MNVSAIGVDVSTVATAVVLLDTNGYRDHLLIQHRTGEQGPRRLMMIGSAVQSALASSRWAPDVAAVEAPLTHNRSFPLESAAAVVMATVQAQWPGLIVLDPTPTDWQADTIGSGKNTKPRSIAHAQANGLDTTDDNLADALCIAEYARELYLRDVVGVIA